MIIHGFQKTTLLDYPGHVAATIFTGGCNFRCPFCHNLNIVEGNSDENISEDEILSFLNKRSGVLEGVCISGGEPTLQKELPEFIRKIKSINCDENKPYLVKLDTNGTNPLMIEELIKEGLIDYIAMDIKSSLSEYSLVAGISNELDITEKIKKSVELIINSGIEYEFRTTIVKQYHSEIVMDQIGSLIKGAKRYYLQSFIDSEYVKDHSLEALDKNTLVKYCAKMKEFVDYVQVRGVD